MSASQRQSALIEDFFEVLRTGAIDRLAEIVTDDCVDGAPLPGQLRGRAGVAQKVLRFRAAHPDADIVIESIMQAAGGARVTWTTRARGLGQWRFIAMFDIGGGKIRATRELGSQRL